MMGHDNVTQRQSTMFSPQADWQSKFGVECLITSSLNLPPNKTPTVAGQTIGSLSCYSSTARGSQNPLRITSSSGPEDNAVVSWVVVSGTRGLPPTAAAVPASFEVSHRQVMVHQHTGHEPRWSSHGSMQGAWNTCPHAAAA
jgi:hypothetical protein